MDTKRQKPKGDSYYDKRALNYDKRRHKQSWWQVEQQQMTELLQTIPDDLTVVDIPFGTGRFVEDYLAHGHQISGLDASDHMLDAAKAALGPRFENCSCVVGNAVELPYLDGQFDLLVSTRFLRDIVTFGAAKTILAEFSRVTRRFAILQLGHGNSDLGYPQDGDVMAGRLSVPQLTELLAQHQFQIRDMRLVKDDDEGQISHILCEKIAG